MVKFPVLLFGVLLVTEEERASIPMTGGVLDERRASIVF